MNWPAPVAAFWRDPYAYLADVLPEPKHAMKRGPKPESREVIREKARLRSAANRAKEKASHGP